jgi:glycosyltransferase involved in cell wall biosynthesis
MRVLHLSASYPPNIRGGAERFVANLAQEQLKRGHEVGVVTLSRAPEPTAKENGVSVFRIGHANLYWPEDWPKHGPAVRYINKLLETWNPITLARVRKAIDLFRPDVVNSHSMVGFAASAWVAAAERGIPVVHTLHDFNLFCRNGNAFHDRTICRGVCLPCRVAQPKRWFARQVSAVVAISSDTLKRHTDRGLFANIPADNKSVVWSISPQVDANEVRSRPADAPFVIGFIGRLTAEKGLDVLIEAAAKLPHREWRLRIAGTISPTLDLETLRKRTANLPVDWLGFVASQDFYRDIDVLVVPSLWAEPFGLVVLEAYSFGVPVIASRVGGIVDIVEPGVTGWLFEPGDSAALSAILEDLIRAGRRALPPPEAFAKTLAATTAGQIASQYDHVYRRVVAETKIPAQ